MTITVPTVTIRTTSDGPGYPHGVVTGSGSTSTAALIDLLEKARIVADELAARLHDHDPAHGDIWGVEMIDVRLTPGPAESGDAGWLAYGTLRSTGRSPFLREGRPIAASNYA